MRPCNVSQTLHGRKQHIQTLLCTSTGVCTWLITEKDLVGGVYYWNKQSSVVKATKGHLV